MDRATQLESVILYQIDKTSKLAKLYSQREFDRLHLDITVEQWILLKLIHENAHISQKDLAEQSLRDPASITRTLDLLQKKALISRMPIPENRRQYNIVLTEKGSQFIDENMHIITQHRQNSTQGLTESEIETLDRLLKKMQENLL